MNMKRMKKTIALVMAAAMLVSIAGCHKKINKVDEDDVIAALEDVLDLEEADDSENESDYYNVVDNYPGREIFIRGYVDKDDDHDESIVITYIVYEDEDEPIEHFEYCYDAVTHNALYKKDDYIAYYEEGELGYAVVEVGEFFDAVYYVDDTVLEVSARSEDDIASAKEFIRELGLPLK